MESSHKIISTNFNAKDPAYETLASEERFFKSRDYVESLGNALWGRYQRKQTRQAAYLA